MLNNYDESRGTSFHFISRWPILARMAHLWGLVVNPLLSLFSDLSSHLVIESNHEAANPHMRP